MLKATTYNDLIRHSPERREALVRAYALFMRQVHAVAMEPGALPDTEITITFLRSVR